jgi:outer membrane protein TolC
MTKWWLQGTLVWGLLLVFSVKADEEPWPEPLTWTAVQAWFEKLPNDLIGLPVLDEAVTVWQAERLGIASEQAKQRGRVSLNTRFAQSLSTPVVGNVSLVAEKPVEWSSMWVREQQQALLQAADCRLIQKRQDYYLQLLEHYMAVLLADLEQSWAVEVMAMHYVRLSRERDNQQEGRSNRTLVLQREVAYETAKIDNRQRQGQQQLTRLSLARLLNRVDYPPDQLLALKMPLQTIPELELLTSNAAQFNPELYMVRQRAKAAELAYRIGHGFWSEGSVLRTELTQTGEDETTWSLKWSVPLWQPERTVKQQQLVLQQKQQRLTLQLQQQKLREELVSLRLSLDHLHQRYKLSQSRLLYLEAVLDDNRARYELEMSSQLGDSLINLSKAQWQSRKTLYELLLTQEKLRILVGEGLCGE